MKHSRLLSPLALAVVLLANGSRVDTLRYTPSAGSSVTKTMTVEGELELDDMSLEMNGMDVSEMIEVEMAMRTSMKLVVTDVYEKVADGRPTKLRRSFDELSSNTHISQSNPVQGDDERDIPMSSDLEGATVVFTWDADGSTYDVAFDGDGDEDLLEGLVEDIDLRGFLPDGEVSEGDTWNVPAEAVRAALAPGGNLKLVPDGGAAPMGGAEQFSPSDMIGELDGTFEATYRGMRDEDGVRVAVIALVIEATSAQDMTSKLEDMTAEMADALPEGMGVDVHSFDGEFDVESEGELLWNVETGLVHSLYVSGQVDMIVDLSMTMKMGEESQDMDQSMSFTGDQTWSLKAGE